MVDAEYEDFCNTEPWGYCSECNASIESYQEHYRDNNGNLACSEDCQRELNFDLIRD